MEGPALLLVIAVVLVVGLAGAALVVSRRRRGGSVHPAATAVAPAGLRARLASTRRTLGLDGLFGGGAIPPSFWADLEEALLAADVGVAATGDLVGRVKERRPVSGEQARAVLEAELVGMLRHPDRGLSLRPDRAVILVVGVNGTGKTTSIAKLAATLDRSGRSVVLAAADTFRGGAESQLRVWGERIGVPVVAGGDGADPAAVAHDAVRSATAPSSVVIVDTAGRLHSKTNLMEELGKVGRVLRKEAGEIDEVLLVVDGTTGQNAVVQARSFTDAVGVTGIVITKLDGTARGGVVVAIERELGIPVKFIGIGETIEDLLPFEPEAYVEALLEP